MKLPTRETRLATPQPARDWQLWSARGDGSSWRRAWHAFRPGGHRLPTTAQEAHYLARHYRRQLPGWLIVARPVSAGRPPLLPR